MKEEGKAVTTINPHCTTPPSDLPWTQEESVIFVMVNTCVQSLGFTREDMRLRCLWIPEKQGANVPP